MGIVPLTNPTQKEREPMSASNTTSAYSVASVEQYASKHGISIADTWLLMYDKYAENEMFTESDRCWEEYLKVAMPIEK